ncbi:MAG TPA: glycosyltransferase family 4 protein [Gammaproteobacteria bacterium]
MTAGVAVLLFAFGASLALGFVLRAERFGKRFLDQPNHRSLHEVPVPRSGGLAIHAAFGLAVLWFHAMSLPMPGAGFWISWLLVVAVSAGDDLRHVPVAVRLGAHMAAAALLLWTLGGIGPSPLITLLAGVLLVWFMNLFNFMDGMDGLAGLMAMMGASCLAVAGLIQGDTAYALLLFAIAAVAGGFLFHNLPPARLFMGDAGSVGLGFLLGAASLYGMSRNLFDWFVPVLAFLPFIADATYTLAMRVRRGHRPWQAHREHLYQRLVLAGQPVRKVLVIEFLIMLACQLAALLIMIMHGSV